MFKMLWTLRCPSSLIAAVYTALLAPAVLAQRPPQPGNINITGTNFLDHNKPISSFYGRTFLEENIPFIDIPDATIQAVYYYRFSALQRHLRYTTAGTGYVLTEFINPVGYAQAFNTIDAAAGHQIDEARWLRSSFYNDDYIQVYTRGPGNGVQYTQWAIDASYRRSLVDGDTTYTTNQLQDFIRWFNRWDPVFDSSAGLYHYTPNDDAQEFSLPGYVDPDYSGTAPTHDGPQTYRPSINAYMAANARAIASIAAQANNSQVASNFTQIAASIEAAIYAHLWDPAQQFFVDVIRPNNTALKPISGREEVGFYPFRFGIGLSTKYGVPAVAQLFDPQGFYAPYGPTTLEIRNQYFNGTRPGCCYWNGQSWPYSTAHTIESLATLYRYGNSSVTVNQYVDLLGIYARTQYKDGMPYVAESHFPFEDAWSSDSKNHSENYDHSTYCQNVITGLLGIVPGSNETLEISPIIPQNWTYFAIENVAYHGHLVTVLYDAKGSRYNQGSGLSVFVDGTKIYNGNKTSALVPLPSRPATNYTVPVNIAANVQGPSAYPTINATYTYVTDWAYKAIDGYLYYDAVPDNRWTNYLSKNSNDTLQLTFARPRNISSLTLALYSDKDRNGSVSLPTSITLTAHNNGGTSTLLVNSSGPFIPNDRNTLSFTQTEVLSVTITFTRDAPKYWVGVCELEIWVPPEQGPVWYAADALLTGGADVVFDPTSNATANGAVVDTSAGKTETLNRISFSGIEIAGSGVNGTATEMQIVYANSGSQAANMTVVINQVLAGSVTLGPSTTSTTGGKMAAYATAKVQVQMPAGKNFVTLVGGGDGVRIESIVVPASGSGSGSGSPSSTSSSSSAASAAPTATGTGTPSAATRNSIVGKGSIIIPSWLLLVAWALGYLAF